MRITKFMGWLCLLVTRTCREVKPCDHLAVCKLKHSQLNIHGKVSTICYFSLVVVVS